MELYVRIAGLVFLLLGALWVALGLYITQYLIAVGGAITATAGVMLLGLARHISRENEDDE